MLEFYERVSGARFHAAYFRPGGLVNDIPPTLISDIGSFLNQFVYRIFELEDLIRDNRIFRQRLVNVAIAPLNMAVDFGFTGVILRSVGLC